MAEKYKVRVEDLVFCCAHFITYDGNTCEAIHGHNYRAAAEVEGTLDENHYVFDFIALKECMRNITAELDHHVLLPTESERIRVHASDREVRVAFEDRTWLFPRNDCVLLPVANTTAERLAWWIAGRLSDDLGLQKSYRPDTIQIEVEEGPGQFAVYTRSRAPNSA